MELSCAYRGSSVHLACYLFDPEAPSLAAELRRIRDDRVNRAKEMVRLLRAAGVGVTWEQVRDIALNGGGDGELEAGVVVGRPHIARAIVAAGAAEDVQDAFDRWIGSGGPAYAARYALDPVRAVRAVREAGGVCSLAHPARAEGTLTGAVPVELAERMVRAGLGGIEADHPRTTRPRPSGGAASPGTWGWRSPAPATTTARSPGTGSECAPRLRRSSPG